jgi:hypothetical protein
MLWVFSVDGLVEQPATYNQELVPGILPTYKP